MEEHLVCEKCGYRVRSDFDGIFCPRNNCEGKLVNKRVYEKGTNWRDYFRLLAERQKEGKEDELFFPR